MQRRCCSVIFCYHRCFFRTFPLVAMNWLIRSVIFCYHRCFFRRHKKDSGLLRRVILISIVQKFNAQHQRYNKQNFYNNIQYSVGTGTRSKNKIHVYGVMGMCSRSASVHNSGAGCQDKRYTGNYHIYCFFSMVLFYYGTFVLSMNGYTVQVH